MEKPKDRRKLRKKRNHKASRAFEESKLSLDSSTSSSTYESSELSIPPPDESTAHTSNPEVDCNPLVEMVRRRKVDETSSPQQHQDKQFFSSQQQRQPGSHPGPPYIPANGGAAYNRKPTDSSATSDASHLSSGQTPTQFRHMAPREFALGGGVRRQHPDMPLPSLPADVKPVKKTQQTGQPPSRAKLNKQSRDREQTRVEQMRPQTHHQNNQERAEQKRPQMQRRLSAYSRANSTLGRVSEEDTTSDGLSSAFSESLRMSLTNPDGGAAAVFPTDQILEFDEGVEEVLRSSLSHQYDEREEYINPKLNDYMAIEDIVQSSASLLVYERHGSDSSSQIEVMKKMEQEMNDGYEEALLKEEMNRTRSQYTASKGGLTRLPEKRPLAIDTRPNSIGNVPLSISQGNTPMSVSTISPNDEQARLAEAASSRFGRLLQQCRQLTQDCSDSNTVESSSIMESDMSRSTRQSDRLSPHDSRKLSRHVSAERADSMLDAKLSAINLRRSAEGMAYSDSGSIPAGSVSHISKEIDATNSDTMMKISQLTIDPEIAVTLRASGLTKENRKCDIRPSDYFGRRNALRAAEQGQDGGAGSDLVSPDDDIQQSISRPTANEIPANPIRRGSFEPKEILHNKSSSGGVMNTAGTTHQVPTASGSIDLSNSSREGRPIQPMSRSIISELSFGVDMMYGETEEELFGYDNSGINNVVNDIDNKSSPKKPRLDGDPLKVEHTLESVAESSSVDKGSNTSDVIEPLPHLPAVKPLNEIPRTFTPSDVLHSQRAFRPSEELSAAISPATPSNEIPINRVPMKDNGPGYRRANSSSARSASLLSDDWSSDDSGGLLVGFGHRPLKSRRPASSISSSSSSSSSGSASGYSSGSGSSSSGSDSGTSSSSSGDDDEEDETSSEESMSLPAPVKNGLIFNTRNHQGDDSVSDMVSELSFGGASALVRHQTVQKTKLLGPLPSPQTPGSSGPISRPVVRAKSPEGSEETSPQSMHSSLSKSSPTSSETPVGKRANNIGFQHNRPYGSSRRSSLNSTKPTDLDALDEVSESNASFLDDISSVGGDNPAVQKFLNTVPESDLGSSFSSTKSPLPFSPSAAQPNRRAALPTLNRSVNSSSIEDEDFIHLKRSSTTASNSAMESALEIRNMELEASQGMPINRPPSDDGSSMLSEKQRSSVSSKSSLSRRDGSQLSYQSGSSYYSNIINRAAALMVSPTNDDINFLDSSDKKSETMDRSYQSASSSKASVQSDSKGAAATSSAATDQSTKTGNFVDSPSTTSSKDSRRESHPRATAAMDRPAETVGASDQSVSSRASSQASSVGGFSQIGPIDTSNRSVSSRASAREVSALSNAGEAAADFRDLRQDDRAPVSQSLNTSESDDKSPVSEMSMSSVSSKARECLRSSFASQRDNLRESVRSSAGGSVSLEKTKTSLIGDQINPERSSEEQEAQAIGSSELLRIDEKGDVRGTAMATSLHQGIDSSDSSQRQNALASSHRSDAPPFSPRDKELDRLSMISDDHFGNDELYEDFPSRGNDSDDNLVQIKETRRQSIERSISARNDLEESDARKPWRTMPSKTIREEPQGSEVGDDFGALKSSLGTDDADHESAVERPQSSQGSVADRDNDGYSSDDLSELIHSQNVLKEMNIYDSYTQGKDRQASSAGDDSDSSSANPFDLFTPQDEIEDSPDGDKSKHAAATRKLSMVDEQKESRMPTMGSVHLSRTSTSSSISEWDFSNSVRASTVPPRPMSDVGERKERDWVDDRSNKSDGATDPKRSLRMMASAADDMAALLDQSLSKRQATDSPNSGDLDEDENQNPAGAVMASAAEDMTARLKKSMTSRLRSSAQSEALEGLDSSDVVDRLFGEKGEDEDVESQVYSNGEERLQPKGRQMDGSELGSIKSESTEISSQKNESAAGCSKSEDSGRDVITPLREFSSSMEDKLAVMPQDEDSVNGPKSHPFNEFLDEYNELASDEDGDGTRRKNSSKDGVSNAPNPFLDSDSDEDDAASNTSPLSAVANDKESDETKQKKESKNSPWYRNYLKSRMCWAVSFGVLAVVICVIVAVVESHKERSPKTGPAPPPALPPIVVPRPPDPPTVAPTTQQPTPLPIPTWIKVGGDLMGESPGDEAGFSVAVSLSGRVIVGARRNGNIEDGLKNRGAARIFEFDSNTGFYEPIHNIYGEQKGDQAGFSVAISSNGKRVAVGSLGSDINGQNSGQVRLFDQDDLSGSWRLVKSLDGEAEGALFGASVSLSEDGLTLVVGAPYFNENSDLPRSGRVYVYQQVSEIEWKQVGGPMSGDSANNLFGWSVSLTADSQLVAVGAPRLEGSSDSGYAQMYSLVSKSWTPYGARLGLGVPGDRFGFSVSSSGGHDGIAYRIAIGAPGMNTNGDGSGLASVYEYSENGWAQTGDDLVGQGGGDNLGYAVSLTKDGSRLVVGIPNKKLDGISVGQLQVANVNSGSITKAGDVYGLEGEQFGVSVSISNEGKLIFGGAPEANLVRAYGGVI